jgi:hypothetical protein
MFSFLNMASISKKSCVAVVKLVSYEGSDTFVQCGNDTQDYLYMIVSIDPDGTAEIMDSSYRTLNEALDAWPEAKPRKTRRR